MTSYITYNLTFWNYLCFRKFGEGSPLFHFRGGVGWPWSGSGHL